MPIDDMMVNEALKGKICKGKSKSGDAPDEINLKITGKYAYDLQQFLESEVSKGGDYFRVRFLVILAEKLRMAVVEARSEDFSKASR
jgi:hypothetical protein